MTTQREKLPHEAVPQGESRRGGLSALALKVMAVMAMIGDHCAAALLPAGSLAYVVLRVLGRITGPVMFFFIAEGYHHTRDVGRYTLRLGVFALVSWPAFFYFRTGALPAPDHFAPVGVIYTLFLGLLAIRARREIKNQLLAALAVVALLLASGIGDWAYTGVALILVFDLFYQDYKKQAFFAGAIFAWLFLADLIAMLIAGTPFTPAVAGGLAIRLGQFLPLLLLRFYNGQRGGGGAFGKWFFYLVYPLHLVVIGMVRYC